MKNLRLKVIKKTCSQINTIINSNNMVTVESAINTALSKVFGINIYVKIYMDREQHEMVKINGCNGGINNFELYKAMKLHNESVYGIEAKKILMSFIPERMHKSGMYQKMIESLNN